jgi:hypothetical protein
MAIIGSHCGSDSLPNELLGVWETTSPKYADCYFELQREVIIFENRNFPESYAKHPLVDFEKTKEKRGTLYAIHYKSDGLEYKFRFFYEPSDGGLIRLKNQPKIAWRKAAVIPR